jgi:ketosteroid isomerase-like protein
MTHPNEQVVRELAAGLSAGKLGKVRSLMTDDVVGHFPGVLGGELHGPYEFLMFFATLLQRSNGSIREEIHEVLANDEHAVVLGRARAVREGREPLDNPWVEVIHFRDGKIAEVWHQTYDAYAVDEFWRE